MLVFFVLLYQIFGSVAFKVPMVMSTPIKFIWEKSWLDACTFFRFGTSVMITVSNRSQM